MTLALAILCLALVGLLAYRERVGARERARAAEESAAATRAIVHVIDQHSRERVELLTEVAKERQELYQRIQAPEVAVAEAVREARGPYEKRKPRGHDHDIHAEVDGG